MMKYVVVVITIMNDVLRRGREGVFALSSVVNSGHLLNLLEMDREEEGERAKS